MFVNIYIYNTIKLYLSGIHRCTLSFNWTWQTPLYGLLCCWFRCTDYYVVVECIQVQVSDQEAQLIVQSWNFADWYIVSRESNPRNSDFSKTTICQCGNTKRLAHILSNSRSSRPIWALLKSTNHALKYRIYEQFHYFGAHFTEIWGIAMKMMIKMSLLDGFLRQNYWNDVIQVKRFIMTLKFYLKFKTPIAVNLDVTKYQPVWLLAI